ncbi:MAG: hypothetical protein LBB94_10195 [Clostridiales bacterium]|jgi:hypothetical protein|nr:hypothetical protein [Clostridiales bacterium]
MFLSKKRIWNGSARYRREKHYCPKCHMEMVLKRMEQIVHSKSPEARKFDFSIPGGEGGYIIGNVKFIWDEFFCEHCGNQITIADMMKYEKRDG